MRILIATDGSRFSEEAIDQCCRMVMRPERDEVLIVSAYEDVLPISAEPFALSSEYYQQMADSLTNLARTCLDAAEQKIAAHFPDAVPEVATEVLRGPADMLIVERAKEWKADLIVVGSHGRGFWGRLLGSVSNGVVHHAPCSVLVVRPHPEGSLNGHKEVS